MIAPIHDAVVAYIKVGERIGGLVFALATPCCAHDMRLVAAESKRERCVEIVRMSGLEQHSHVLPRHATADGRRVVVSMDYLLRNARIRTSRLLDV